MVEPTRLTKPDRRRPEPLWHQAEMALRELIDRLAELYAKHLVEVTHLIHSTLDRKAQKFADAFRLRKDT